MKAIALAVCVLMISLSMPHFSLWGFGVSTVSASTSDPCSVSQNNGKYTCDESVVTAGKYDIFKCVPGSFPNGWVSSSIPGESGFNSLSGCTSICTQNYPNACVGGGTQSPPPQGGLSSATVTTTPAQPVAGQSFNLRFQFSSQLPTGARVEFDLDRTGIIFSCGVNSCAQPLTVAVSGTYPIAARLLTGNTASPISLNIQQVTVQPGTTSPGSTVRQCCVTKNSETSYDYESIDQASCEGTGQVGRIFRADVCSNVQNTVCSEFCRTKAFNGGQCLAFGTVQDTSRQFGGVCQTGTCQCGAINQQEVRARESCQNFCMTTTQFAGSFSSVLVQQSIRIPISQCTSNPEIFYSTLQISGGFGGAAVGTQTTIERGPVGNLGENQCAADERCVCAYTRVNAVSTNNPPNGQPTIPGSQGTPRWDPPDDIESPPTKTPNDRNCAAAVNATITAAFGTAQMGQTPGGQAQISGLRLVQAGDPITITGKVVKLADQCNGYQYDCRSQQEVDCNLDSGFLKTKLEYKECPAIAGTRIHEEGEKEVTNWRRIGAIVGTAAGIVAIVATGGSAAPALAGPTATMAGQVATSSCDASQVDALVAAALQIGVRQAIQSQQNNNPSLPNQPTPPTTPTDTCTSGCAASSEQCLGALFDSGKTCSNGGVCCVNGLIPTAAAVADPTFRVNGESVITGNAVAPPGTPRANTGGGFNYGQLAALAPVLVQMFPNCPSPEDIVACFSVCGKEYKSRVTYNPSCERGGAVIDFEEKEYFCGLGECGGFAGKRISIKVYGPDGSLAIEDSATAGSEGEFSYTFNSPAGDGDFTVIATVPRE